MATAIHPRTADLPLARGGANVGGSWRTALLTTLAVIVGALLISTLMVMSTVLTGSVTWSEGGPVPQPMPQPVPYPSAEAGFDL